MTIHVSANSGCNLGCSYCYEEPDRQHSQADIDAEYDIEEIMARLRQFEAKYDEVPGMHGGEPLLVRDEHLERIFSWIYETYDLEETGRHTHIQTNGTLLTEEHVEMFERYRVSVGISCDGPADLNDNRLARSEMDGELRDVTERMTERTLDAIDTLKESDVGVGVIVVLTKQNAGTDERLDRLLEWMDDLTRHDVGGHYNPAIPYEDVQEDESLSPERLKEVYLRTWEWMKAEPYRHWGPMGDYQDNLLGNKLSNCVNNTCDVFNAGAAKIATGDGATTGCGKTWAAAGDGNAFLQGDSTGNEYNDTEERYEMLKQVPGPHTDDEDDHGGCKGCRYWNVCQGGCPSAGIEYDYRNRTRWCAAKYALYERIEDDMRSMFPGLRLVTDAPWDAPLAEETSRRNVDIKPFAGLHFGQSSNGKPTVRGGAHDESDVWSLAHDSLSFDEVVEQYRDRYDEEHLTIDRSRQSVHADSDSQ
ncbi:radical SAM protein [Halovivax cerinus]|uniref:Radical SAM protein n=1 Tax=Halovivax cerinus TaxID=1487865 RepID=A0ABD5NKW4_9EURY|nr:radical SAM protein [Halovivax cerinus]